MIASGTKLIFADTGNSRIVSIDTATCGPAVAAAHVHQRWLRRDIRSLASVSTARAYVASDTAGQIYSITSGGVVTSLGLSNGAAPKDGVVGVLGTSPLAPIPYTTQGQAANFFGSASVPTIPYNIPPFSAAGPVFAVAPAGIAGGYVQRDLRSNRGCNNLRLRHRVHPGHSGAATTALTAGSYLFTDKGSAADTGSLA